MRTAVTAFACADHFSRLAGHLEAGKLAATRHGEPLLN
jgi:hypothetical protein